ncbi:MAG: Gfo/Idh/MocA family oxidoreductase [Treponema sp.]|nr:Gfo/Idh/MocA family oxidoreductase [Treponema sp.]
MIKVAIIGTGNVARMHIDAYRAFPQRCRITHLVDIASEKAEALNKSLGLGAKVGASHGEILGEDFDLASVCGPPFSHAKIAADLLRAGKNALVEKPMAVSLQECDEMIAAQKAGGKMLSVIAQNRFREPIAALKKVLDSGLIGKIVHAQIDSLWWRGHSYYDLWWRGTWEKEGGGCTLNHAVHHIDMLCWMLGMPASVVAMLGNAAHDNAEVEDISIAALRYEGGEGSLCSKGALAQLTSSVVHHGQEQQLVFQGEKARVSAPWKAVAQIAQKNGFPAEARDEALEKKLNDIFAGFGALPHELHAGQIDDALRAIEMGCAPAITAQDGRNAIELITAIYKAGAEGRHVSLPIAADDPFYTVEGFLSQVPRFYKKTASVQDLGAGEGISLGTI